MTIPLGFSVHFGYPSIHRMRSIPFHSVVLIFSFIIRHNFSTLITDEKEAWKLLLAEDEKMYNNCLKGEYSLSDTTIDTVAWQNFTDPLVKRAFELNAQKQYYVGSTLRISNTSDGQRRGEIWNEKRNILSKTKVCTYETKDMDGNCTMERLFDILRNYDKSENNDERKYYWVDWHNAIGKMRGIYDEDLQILKRLNLFPDYNDWWLYFYEEPTSHIREEMERVMQEILPLHKELHAYIRRRLINQYGSGVITSDGPIPSQLLGLWEYNGWRITFVPYPEKALNITEKLKEKNITPVGMLKLAEDFYHSLGLPYIDDEFWDNIDLSTKELCYYNFHYTCKPTISGASGCMPITAGSLHKLIGAAIDIHWLKLRQAEMWPNVLIDVPNPAFRMAFRHALELPTWTVDYLSQIGLVEPIPMDIDEVTEFDINQLMEVAIRFFTLLPSLMQTAKWKWDSLDFVLSNDNYNRRWWEYSLKYQGVCPPVRRSEESFDPASSMHLANGLQLVRDFIGVIYGFQFYEAACKEAGHTDLLHRCNLYGARTFGDKIREVYTLGKSINGSQGISIMTNGESDKMDTKPLLEYFRPLYEWLKNENEGETVGWKSDDPMICPQPASSNMIGTKNQNKDVFKLKIKYVNSHKANKQPRGGQAECRNTSLDPLVTQHPLAVFHLKQALLDFVRRSFRASFSSVIKVLKLCLIKKLKIKTTEWKGMDRILCIEG